PHGSVTESVKTARNPWARAGFVVPRRQASFAPLRPVTPEAAGSSPVAPAPGTACMRGGFSLLEVQLRAREPDADGRDFSTLLYAAAAAEGHERSLLTQSGSARTRAR